MTNLLEIVRVETNEPVANPSFPVRLGGYTGTTELGGAQAISLATGSRHSLQLLEGDDARD